VISRIGGEIRLGSGNEIELSALSTTLSVLSELMLQVDDVETWNVP
jgi:hypothetical protein